jgi:hypothetical protein
MHERKLYRTVVSKRPVARENVENFNLEKPVQLLLHFFANQFSYNIELISICFIYFSIELLRIIFLLPFFNSLHLSYQLLYITFD